MGDVDSDQDMWNAWTSAIADKKQVAYDNFLLSLQEQNSKKASVSSKPYMLFLDPVSFCNLQCPLCPTGTKTLEREPVKMHVDTFKHIMEHLGPYVFELKLFNWGEPLLHREIAEMIRCAKSHHVVVTISSNMSVNMQEGQIRDIVDAGLDFLICSVDGASQQTYEKYRVAGIFRWR